jgi:T5SS/PEP-CTERM-associated repeat protein
MYTTSCAVHALIRFIPFRSISTAMLVVIAAASLTGSAVRAAVVAIDDVAIDLGNGQLIADNPFTEELEGLAAYPTGNGINLNDPVNAQTRWELNADIIVGIDQPFGGRLDIDGNSKLRFQDLILGSRNDATDFTGNGRVLITGLQALYSNNPNSRPPGLPANFGVDASVARALDVGFDLIVGEWGVDNTMEIRGGGRAEIQDAVIVGDNPGSNGDLIIDGFASLLASGGFEGNVTDMDPHQMIIGRRGFGRMTVRNGGSVITEAPSQAGTATSAVVGAIIGAFQALDNEAPELGGTGQVYVNGLSTKWTIGGSLQIGGFHDAVQGMGEDFDGDNVEYATDSGTGTLYVQDGGLVQLRPRLGVVGTDEDLILAIGRFGELNLSGGTVLLGVGTDDGGPEDNTQLLNDGVITGGGFIQTGVFVNRYFGEVRVNPAQSLVIEASAEFLTPAQDNPPLANFGNIQVLGSGDLYAELEFERAPDTPLEPIQPFLNLRVPRPVGAPPADFYGGLISAQHSRLRFRSGLLNIGMVAFTAGENYVTGNVINGVDPDFLADPGIIVFRGPGTKVVFENDLICGVGVCDVGAGVTIDVLADHTFITAGDLRINLNPINPSHITSAGDVGIAGKLTVNMSGFSPGSLAIGDSFEIISFAGDIGGVDLSDPLRPVVDFSVAPVFSQIQVPNLVSLGLPVGTVLIPEFTPSSVLLTIRSLIGFIGPDFNGDNIVDFLDLEIWKMNKGILSGATVLQGDANGDGAVNGTDYLIWFSQLGMPPMPGAGSGSSVPEPASLAMLSIAAMLALAFGRRRA